MLIVASCENTDWGEGDGDPSLLEYELSEDGTYYIVAGIGDYVGEHLVIPEEYNGLPVKKIAQDAFSEQDGKDNSALLAIKAITIADSVTEMGKYMSFTDTNIEQLNLGSGVSESIISWSFGMSNNLKAINVSKDNQTYMSKDGVLYTKDGTELLKYPQQKEDKSFRIPRSVKKIGLTAFSGNKNIKKVKMSNHLTTIGAKAFYRTTLEEIKIPNSVEIIESDAFDSCRNLKKVNIGKNVKAIGNGAFNYTGIEEIKLPDNIEILGLGAFESCDNLKKIHIGSGIKEIAAYTFENCSSLENVVIPKNIEKIGTYAFAYCDNLTKVYYEGNEDEWVNVQLVTMIYDGIWDITRYDQPIFSDNTQIYIYSKKRPNSEGNYWRYVVGVPTAWKN